MIDVQTHRTLVSVPLLSCLYLANAQAAYERLSQAEDELYKTNEQIHYTGQYLSTKEVQQQFTKAIFKKKFRAEHSKELDAYAESVKYFREENDGKLPLLKSLKKRKEELTKEIAERKKAYVPLREESRRLEIASDNVYSIFRKTNEMKSDLAWKRKWEAKVREKARQEQARQEQRERQPKRTCQPMTVQPDSGTQPKPSMCTPHLRPG